MSDPRTELVGAGYDAMIDTWESWKDRITDDPRADWCGELLMRLPEGAHVVESGCGGGTPETERLAERFRLTGVDLSEAQLDARSRARAAGRLHQSGLHRARARGRSCTPWRRSTPSTRPPRPARPLYERIRAWLVPGGLFLTALGTSDTDNWTGDFLGAPNYFSSFPPDVNSRMLREAGFELLRDELVTITEPEGGATFQWILARR